MPHRRLILQNAAARPPARADRRTFARHRPARRATCVVRRQADGPGFAGGVWNLSTRGLALLAGEAVAAGAVVWVRVINEGMTFCLEAKLRVTRCEKLATGEHFIGGELDRVLGPADLLPFLL